MVPGEAPIIPIILVDPLRTLKYSRRLEDHGVFATAIRPTTVPPGTSRIRLTLVAGGITGAPRARGIDIGVFKPMQSGHLETVLFFSVKRTD